jgi:hypothetical protein
VAGGWCAVNGGYGGLGKRTHEGAGGTQMVKPRTMYETWRKGTHEETMEKSRNTIAGEKLHGEAEARLSLG